MTKRVDDSERLRKAKAPKGTRTQVRVTFLLDEEHADFLNQQPNKGRFLNNLISKARGQ